MIDNYFDNSNNSTSTTNLSIKFNKDDRVTNRFTVTLDFNENAAFEDFFKRGSGCG